MRNPAKGLYLHWMNVMMNGHTNISKPSKLWQNKTNNDPHQGNREMARRRRQIASGMIKAV